MGYVGPIPAEITTEDYTLSFTGIRLATTPEDKLAVRGGRGTWVAVCVGAVGWPEAVLTVMGGRVACRHPSRNAPAAAGARLLAT